MEYTPNAFFSGKRCFFAAANGYEGFRSYFNEFFRPDDYTHTFVLKGGPGTGKSRLIHTIGAFFEDSGCHTEWIFCSSDPASLDGVILMDGGRRVAILDGTAPHERDAVIPGAIDTLVDLGQGWDEDALIQRRPDILTLTAIKRSEYKKAYEYLHIADEYDKKIEADIKNTWKSEDVFDCIRTRISEKSALKNGTFKNRPIAAFCRYGYIILPTYEHMADTVLYPVGAPVHRTRFLDALAKEVKERGISHLRAPSPFTERHTDALFLTDNRIAIVSYPPTNEAGAIAVELPLSKSQVSATMRVYEEVHQELIQKAQQALSYAAEAHASLERIYTPAMNFDNNEKLMQELIRRIKKLMY